MGQNIPKSSVNIIPKPLYSKVDPGHFIIDEKTKIEYSKSVKNEKRIAEFLSESIKYLVQINIPVDQYKGTQRGDLIIFEITKSDTLGGEGYQLLINPNYVKIIANSGRGLFYGVQSFLQLIPPEDVNENDIEKIIIPCLEIKDRPEYKYRGMHLDVSRHFFPKEFIKKYIDLLAMYKMNMFHWHLTDDNGWRIEIKKYPSA